MKKQGSKKCSMWDEKTENVMHILSECLMLTQIKYKKRHNKVTTIFHWKLCSKYGFEPTKHW